MGFQSCAVAEPVVTTVGQRAGSAARMANGGGGGGSGGGHVNTGLDIAVGSAPPAPSAGASRDSAAYEPEARAGASTGLRRRGFPAAA
ncbi:hypothetical protein NESM_000763900 [Novymonas esmeraldas]|uniref:Uncharacterized protein n=1 Tax=Novymonas esmeraldas TaxID=1808958 RepID=A0AAW0EZ38_9TRYP